MSAVLEFVPSTMTCTGAVSPLRSCSAKPGWICDRDGRVAAIDEIGELGLRRARLPITSKRPLAVKRDDQLAALLAVVTVEHRGRDAVDLERRRVAEHQHLDERRHHEADARVPVAAELEELLDQHVDRCARAWQTPHVERLAEGPRREGPDDGRIDDQREQRLGERREARCPSGTPP